MLFQPLRLIPGDDVADAGLDFAGGLDRCVDGIHCSDIEEASEESFLQIDSLR